MKQLVFLFASFLGLSSFASGGHGHDQHPAAAVQIQAVSSAQLNAGKISFQFTLLDSDNGKSLGDQDLVESHTKKLHFIAYDRALKEFNHVHPTFNQGVWTAELELPVSGHYFFWAQGTLADGTEFSAPIKTEVVNGQPAWPVVDLGDHRTGSDKGTVVELSSRPLHALKMAMIDYQVRRDDGLSPVITPYLGAMAHVIAVSPDGEKMLHVHPMEGSSPDTGMLHTTFPVSGDYRLWVQLNDRDELKTVPLSITVLP